MSKFKITIANTLISLLAVLLPISAGQLNPDSGPGDTMKTLEEIYCQYARCQADSYGLDSPAATSSTMHTLQEIYDKITDFSLFMHQIYDDLNCANNNAESDSACAASDAEYTGEEAEWASSTDASLAGALVASGKVYLDLRTGLYWSDAYDAVSNSNTPDTRTNSFTIGTGCSDAQINSGACDSSMFETAGQAIQQCLDLSLDADGDTVDETDWRLPTQKELQLACASGAANYLPNTDYYFWCSTEAYNSSNSGLYVNLADCETAGSLKNKSYYVNCVRP